MLSASPKLTQITAVVVNYNGVEFIEDCLRALIKAEQGPDHILVVDNASTDGSQQLIKSVFPQVQLHLASTNLGFAAANNLALDLSDSDWLVLINPDAFVDTQFFSKLRHAIRTDHSTHVFSARLIDHNDNSLLDGEGDAYHVSGLAWRRGHGKNLASYQAKYPFFAPCAAAAAYRRDAFEAVGGFDEDYFCYFEDVDIGFRMHLAGYQIRHMPDLIAHHVGSGITQKHSDFSVYYGHRNLIDTFIKNMPLALLIRYLPQHILMNVIAVLHYARQGQGNTILRAKWHALLALPRTLEKRRAVQSTRTLPSQQLQSLFAQGWMSPYRDRS